MHRSISSASTGVSHLPQRASATWRVGHALLLAGAIAVAPLACSTAPATREAPAELPRAATDTPIELTGEARETMLRLIAAHGRPDREDLRTPGSVTAFDGERLAYDRYLVVGSTITVDRGTAFREFVAALGRHGGDFRTVETTAGVPSKVLVRQDGLRYVVAVGQW